MLRRSLFIMLLAGCSTTTAPPQADGPAPAPATASPITAAPVVAGRWSSPSCGPRSYERLITLEAGGTFTAEDRVSPCPRGVSCVWSGIVLRRGTYSISGEGIRAVLLATDGGAGLGQGLPATLVIDGAGALVEVLPEGDRCVYTRVRP